MTPAPQPHAPAHVERALSATRTVLYADLGLRGNLRARFASVLGIDYEPAYVAFDGPAISWNVRHDVAFERALFRDRPLAAGATAFVAAMGRTTRLLDKACAALASPNTRRPGHRLDLLQDLQAFWDVRELHAVSLFMFWNVEHRVGEELTRHALGAGLSAEADAGLPRFMRPSESSWFELERRQLSRLARRFDGVPVDVLADHRERFGFVLAPFTIGPPPPLETVRARLQAAEDGAVPDASLKLRAAGDPLDDCDEPLSTLGRLAQELAFWKNERIDAMARADAAMGPLYEAVAQALALDPRDVLAMRREEIEASLTEGYATVDAPALAARRARYCLILHRGRIAFHKPSDDDGPPQVAAIAGERLHGRPTSAGVVTGRAVVIPDPLAVVARPELAERVRQGDVLVTSMTRPEMGVVLHRASAWVTDEGGRVSHAAIMARELRKPCVTAVADATRRLRDGMVVTVDGGAGVVTVEQDAPPASHNLPQPPFDEPKASA